MKNKSTKNNCTRQLLSYASVGRAFSSEVRSLKKQIVIQLSKFILTAISECIIIIISDFCILASVCLSSYPTREEEATGKHSYSSSIT